MKQIVLFHPYRPRLMRSFLVTLLVVFLVGCADKEKKMINGTPNTGTTTGVKKPNSDTNNPANDPNLGPDSEGSENLPLSEIAGSYRVDTISEDGSPGTLVLVGDIMAAKGESTVTGELKSGSRTAAWLSNERVRLQEGSSFTNGQAKLLFDSTFGDGETYSLEFTVNGNGPYEAVFNSVSENKTINKWRVFRKKEDGGYYGYGK